jgi:hypothetical protein
VRLLAEAACEQVIDMLGNVTPPAVADPDEPWKLAYVLAWWRVYADERAEQLQGTLGLLLAEPADEQLQPLPRFHTPSLTANAITCCTQTVIRLRRRRWQGVDPVPPVQGRRRSSAQLAVDSRYRAG